MLRVIILSLLLLVVLFLGLRACAPSPEQVEDRRLLAELNREEGRAYREANQGQPGVMTLQNGLQLELLRLGDGPLPTLEDWVQVHYRGSHLDGRGFLDSYRETTPATVAIAQTIPAWRQALVELPVGSRARLVVPPDLAYGLAGSGPIGPAETLLFELELLAIVEPPSTPESDPSQALVPGLR